MERETPNKNRKREEWRDEVDRRGKRKTGRRSKGKRKKQKIIDIWENIRRRGELYRGREWNI